MSFFCIVFSSIISILRCGAQNGIRDVTHNRKGGVHWGPICGLPECIWWTTMWGGMLYIWLMYCWNQPLGVALASFLQRQPANQPCHYNMTEKWRVRVYGNLYLNSYRVHLYNDGRDYWMATGSFIKMAASVLVLNGGDCQGLGNSGFSDVKVQ